MMQRFPWVFQLEANRRSCKGNGVRSARQLASIWTPFCGERGICSKCHGLSGYGQFPKPRVTVARMPCRNGNSVEARYQEQAAD